MSPQPSDHHQRPHALFPGTFDPVTLGHCDILKRALTLFSRLTIAVATHPEKQHLFSLEERLSMLREVAGDLPGVKVVALQGLVVEGCRKISAQAIVRGLRGATDLEYERAMALTNRVLAPEIETVFLIPAATHSNISSTLVRQIASMGGDCSALVPPAAVRALCKRFPRPPS